MDAVDGKKINIHVCVLEYHKAVKPYCTALAAVDSEKMSKSLGNFFTIRDVIKQYHVLALRLFLVSTQYRAPINYTQRALEEVCEHVDSVSQCCCNVGVAELCLAQCTTRC